MTRRPRPSPELSELEEARRQADEYLADLRRVAADFDNFRKRVARDAEDQARRAIEGIMGELLPVLDNLERALEASEHHEEAKVAEGVSLVRQQLAEVHAPPWARSDRRRARRRLRSARPRGAFPSALRSAGRHHRRGLAAGLPAGLEGGASRCAWSSPAVPPPDGEGG